MCWTRHGNGEMRCRTAMSRLVRHCVLTIRFFIFYTLKKERISYFQFSLRCATGYSLEVLPVSPIVLAFVWHFLFKLTRAHARAHTHIHWHVHCAWLLRSGGSHSAPCWWGPVDETCPGLELWPNGGCHLFYTHAKNKINGVYKESCHQSWQSVFQ